GSALSGPVCVIDAPAFAQKELFESLAPIGRGLPAVSDERAPHHSGIRSRRSRDLELNVGVIAAQRLSGGGWGRGGYARGVEVSGRRDHSPAGHEASLALDHQRL